MLDKRCLAFLEYIDKACDRGGYKIFAVEELVSAMPAEFGADAEGVEECVLNLSAKEYISVKYMDEAEICLSPLTKGRLVFEQRLDEEIEKSRAEKRYFAFAFLGALSGGALVALFAAVIRLLAGGA